jgi:partitioning defective protein 3
MMKVTVSFNTVKIVVPCGDGELTVRELTQLANIRYKKATGKPRHSWVSVHSLKAKEGGILDPDDRLADVCDDREQLIAFYNEEGIPQGGDGMSASSDESESTSGFSRNDIEVHSDHSSGVLQVRRGSEPALNKISSSSLHEDNAALGYYDEHSKRWSAAVMSRDVRSSKNDLSVIDEASFYSESTLEGTGKLSPLPPPFERGRGSGAARDSDRPTPFSRDSNRLSIQVGYEDSKWLEAAERAAKGQQIQDDIEYRDSPVAKKEPSKPKPRSIDAKIEMFESASQRRGEPVGGTSPPQRLAPSSNAFIDPNDLTHISIQNEIGPLGIHVVPSGDPVNPGLVIQGIEPGGRIDRNGILAVNDRIIEINGHNLIDLPFNKSQEVFKEALYSKDLHLSVIKCKEEYEGEVMVGSNYFLSDENKENIENEIDSFG